MKFYILILLALYTVNPAFASESLKIHIIENDNEPLRIQQAISTKTVAGVWVHGRVTTSCGQHLPAGHVDIATYSPDGALIAQTTADLRSQNLSRREKRKGRVRFSGEVVGHTPPGSTVKIAYHLVGSTKESPLGHSVQ